DLELRVEVDLVVDRVHEAVQALTGVHVPTGGEDAQRVRAFGELGQSYFGVVEAGGGIGQQLAVELDLLHGLRDEVHEGGPRLAGGEAQGRLGEEGPLVRGEVQADVVGVGAEERGAAAGLVASEILGCHGLHPATRGRGDRAVPVHRRVRSRSQV